MNLTELLLIADTDTDIMKNVPIVRGVPKFQSR